MGKRNKKILRVALIYSVSIFAAVAIAEGYLRLVDSPDFVADGRVLFFSEPAFVENDDGTITYPTNKVIRTLAIYGQKIEYDITFETNNLGLIDEIDYPHLIGPIAGKRVSIVVGDSATSGHHAERLWVKTMQDRLPDERVLYNFGVSATGAYQFISILENKTRPEAIDDLYVVAISHDFFRRDWHPEEYPDILDENDGPGAPAVCLLTPLCQVRTFERSVDARNLVVVTHKVYEKRPKDLRYYIRNIMIYRKIIWPLRREFSKPLITPRALFGRLREHFPDTRIVWIRFPEKIEAASSKYFIDYDKGAIAELNIEVFPALTVCGFTIDDYHELDPHPNQKGYDKIAKCVLDHVVKGQSPA